MIIKPNVCVELFALLQKRENCFLFAFAFILRLSK